MQKILLFIILSTLVYASYNPFFQDKQTSKPEKQIAKSVVVKKVQQKPAITPARKNAKITYFGFIQSKKGKFALINFND